MRLAFSVIFSAMIFVLLLCAVSAKRSHKAIGNAAAWFEVSIIPPVAGNLIIISTQNRKARKYRKKTDITLLVPDIENSVPVNDISERLELEQKYMRRYNDEQKAQMMADLTYFRKEMASFIERSVIIKEDLKSIAEFVLSIFFGVLFSAASVFLIYAYFFMK